MAQYDVTGVGIMEQLSGIMIEVKNKDTNEESSISIDSEMLICLMRVTDAIKGNEALAEYITNASEIVPIDKEAKDNG